MLYERTYTNEVNIVHIPCVLIKNKPLIQKRIMNIDVNAHYHVIEKITNFLIN